MIKARQPSPLLHRRSAMKLWLLFLRICSTTLNNTVKLVIGHPTAHLQVSILAWLMWCSRIVCDFKVSTWDFVVHGCIVTISVSVWAWVVFLLLFTRKPIVHMWYSNDHCGYCAKTKVLKRNTAVLKLKFLKGICCAKTKVLRSVCTSICHVLFDWFNLKLLTYLKGRYVFERFISVRKNY